ncbi:hypothetical protein GWC95_05935 [Sediminibacterium roseum]|uniref:Killing trait domain-containing protein n=1 Tax=Sediminibacterium roseum TaxID=1978412 RepID=A0ABW9ZQS9_9BACT|nr:hypothetical protein [Sediminibacterium roseum]NCI49454.1 hypothetical protein [Sediminibacterium roseum]
MPNTSLTTLDTAITPEIITTEGAGKAYQSVAQSTAITIQDATDNLRNINTIGATVLGVAMAKALENPATASQYDPIIKMAEGMVSHAASNFLTIGQYAAQVLEGYPSGS